jgi:hypothetical protein
MKPGSSRSRAAARSPRWCSTGCAIRPSPSRCAASSIRARATPVCQFSFVCDGSLYRRPALGAWKEAEQIAAPRSMAMSSARSARRPIIMPIMSRRAGRRAGQDRQIGAHIFYRWPGAWGQPPPSPAATSASRAIRCRCARRCARRSDRRQRRSGRIRPITDRRSPRAERRRRPARHVEGLDAQHSDAVGSSAAAKAIADQAGQAREPPRPSRS